MVNYTGTAALLAITYLSATSIKAEGRQATSTVRVAIDEVEQQRLRKLYGVATGSHFVTDVQTKCEEVMAGNPKVCLKVCVEVTSIKSGDSVIEETSKVTQTKCDESNVKVETEGWAGDGYTEVKVKEDSWKCVETVSYDQLSSPTVIFMVNTIPSLPHSHALIYFLRDHGVPPRSLLLPRSRKCGLLQHRVIRSNLLASRMKRSNRRMAQAKARVVSA